MPSAAKEKPDLAKKVHEVPHKPGVYLMRDRFNRVIYVGKARDLRKRVGSYFMPSKLAQADIKTRAVAQGAVTGSDGEVEVIGAGAPVGSPLEADRH